MTEHEGFGMTEGLDKRLRETLDTAYETLERLRDRGDEAGQYPDVKQYVLDPYEVWLGATKALYAIENAAAILKGEEPPNDLDMSHLEGE